MYLSIRCLPHNISHAFHKLELVTRLAALHCAAGIVPAKLVVYAFSFHFRRALHALPHLPLASVGGFAANRGTAKAAIWGRKGWISDSIDRATTICRCRRGSIHFCTWVGTGLVLSVTTHLGFVT